MKKLMISLASLGLGLLVLTGCGNEKEPDPSNIVEPSDNDDKRSNCKEVLSQVLTALGNVTTNNLTSNVIDTNASITRTDDFEEVTDQYNTNATRAIIKLTELLYENNTYPVTDKIVYSTSTCYNEELPYEYNAQNIKTKIDTNNNKMLLEVYGITRPADEITKDEFYNTYVKTTDLIYVNVDIDFNFELKELTSFSLYLGMYGNNGTGNAMIAMVYENDTLYQVTNQSKLTEICNSYKGSYDAFKAGMNDVVIAGDYSKEYTDATIAIFGKDYFNQK